MTASVLILAALSIITALAGFYLLYSELREESHGSQVQQRLRRLSATPHNRDEWNQPNLALDADADALDRLMEHLPRLKDMDRFLEQAGVGYGPTTALGLTALSGAAGAIVVSLAFRSFAIPVLLIGAILGAAVPWLLLRRRRTKRNQLMVQQLPDMMDFFARSLRAGNPFVSSLKTAADELQDPIAREMGITFDEMNYGLEFEEAMRNMADRVNSEEVRLFITSVLIQKSTGGNLAELMNRLSALLRERERTRGEIEVLATDVRSSAKFLVALPLLVGLLLQVMNPEYLPVLLENETGRLLVMIQLGLMATGYLIMRRMINFRI
ncbi:MAG: type II secretion system F family protein [Pseudomonadota bacterium]